MVLLDRKGFAPFTLLNRYLNLWCTASWRQRVSRRAVNRAATTTNHYDADGNLTEEDTPEGVIHHVFDPATGELIETYTANTDTHYAYDAQDRLGTTTADASLPRLWKSASTAQPSSATSRFRSTI
jgi:YD repeat-containing protein